MAQATNLAIKGLNKQYEVKGQALPVLQDINLEIAGGEFVISDSSPNVWWVATIEALSPCEYFTLSRGNLHRLCEKAPGFAEWLKAIAAARVRTLLVTGEADLYAPPPLQAPLEAPLEANVQAQCDHYATTGEWALAADLDPARVAEQHDMNVAEARVVA